MLGYKDRGEGEVAKIENSRKSMVLLRYTYSYLLSGLVQDGREKRGD
jgi:hypothetical protein